ncbi:MAG: MBL fold metallo-hydrolase [Desulfatibacillaceae bacterium]
MDERGERKTGPIELAPHVHMLGTSEFPYFLIRGSEACAIFEGGISALATVAMDHLASLDVFVPLRYLVAAHTHTDHVTGLVRLKRAEPRLVFIATHDSAKVLAREKVVTHFADEDMMYCEQLVEKGVLPTVPAPMSGDPVMVDREVTDLETLDLGGVTLEFLEAPGHAPGNLCVRVPEDGVLFATDTPGYAQTPQDVYPMFFHDYARYMESLERLKTLEFDTMFLGHNVGIHGRGQCMAFVDHALAEARIMRADMANRVSGGEDREKVAREWGQRLGEFPFFTRFPERVLTGFADLLIRRSLEAEQS